MDREVERIYYDERWRRGELTITGKTMLPASSGGGNAAVSAVSGGNGDRFNGLAGQRGVLRGVATWIVTGFFVWA